MRFAGPVLYSTKNVSLVNLNTVKFIILNTERRQKYIFEYPIIVFGYDYENMNSLNFKDTICMNAVKKYLIMQCATHQVY